MVAATHNKRTREGSRSKYSAIPPATPAHIRSRLLRIRRLGFGGGGVVGVGENSGGGGDAVGNGLSAMCAFLLWLGAVATRRDYRACIIVSCSMGRLLVTSCCISQPQLVRRRLRHIRAE